MTETQKSEIEGYISEGLTVQDAFTLCDLVYNDADSEMAALARNARLYYKQSLLRELKTCITEQCAGGKANSAGITWLLEREFPEDFGKAGAGDGALPITINLGGTVELRGTEETMDSQCAGGIVTEEYGG